jgi:hypothetical protein
MYVSILLCYAMRLQDFTPRQFCVKLAVVNIAVSYPSFFKGSGWICEECLIRNISKTRDAQNKYHLCAKTSGSPAGCSMSNHCGLHEL